jgi:formamidopyrimidine-DNA glycosylase
MPELPDLVRVERVLRQVMVGKRVTAARLGDPTVLRVMVPEAFPAILLGGVVSSVDRRGHFMRFAFLRPGNDDELVLVVNAMLVGRYKVLGTDEAAREKDPTALGFALVLDGGSELRYIDDKRMGKVYVAHAADEARIPVYAELGVDVLSPHFDRPRFQTLARQRRDQVRMFLMDKRALASIGNAYADEILFAARIHPKTFMRQLTDVDLDRLFGAIGQVLRHAVAVIQSREQPVEVKVRDFLAVRGRDGKPCPVCGTTIRAVRVGDGDACFCPTCQPTTRRLFVNWERLPSTTGAEPVSGPSPAPPAAGGKAPRPRRSPRSGSRRRAPSGS